MMIKKITAEAVLDKAGMVVGVGTGSTTNFFIDDLARMKGRIDGAVSSSEATTWRLGAHGIPVLDLNAAGLLLLYVGGADESNRQLQLIKGGGAALTRKKIVAKANRTFVCIIDESKMMNVLGQFPLLIEVIPMAHSLIGWKLLSHEGRPVWQESCVTDNGNWILDVHDLSIREPAKLEAELNNIPGVVTVGLFALRPADVLLMDTPSGVQELTA